ncbi:MAG: AAA family ATPase [Desulfobacterales bacterium]|nr:AAA family ATPase [Desulfobacterales bacterium]MDD4391703.1 AAA family ATPase [Desulfobacterales bacterium]
MYKQFFGFKEKPFKLVPNPSYLFLSRCHEEALAHLTYAVSQSDGFVEITGEVGTGKTTLCRVFLETLGDNVEVAYIFNPRLDSLQLLKAINDELGIRSDAENTKDLIDILNQFLMEKKAAGRTVILLIDEAQNLSEEVLEQLRLLSNLETTLSKLIQIILVGQPELGKKLDSPNLRQLAQRITLRYHLRPLSRKETKAYIQHRLHIAAQKPDIRFSPSACRKIFYFSGGIPRLINIVCDRALLAAYVRNEHQITGRLAASAISELRSGARHRFSRYPGLITLAAALLVSGIITVLVTSYGTNVRNALSLLHQRSPATSETARNPADTVQPKDDHHAAAVSFDAVNPTQFEYKPEPRPLQADKPDSSTSINLKEDEGQHSVPASGVTRDLSGYLASIYPNTSRVEAFRTAVSQWATDRTISSYLEDVNLNDDDFFYFLAKQHGLTCTRIKNSLALIGHLNLPVVLKCQLPDTEATIYLTLIQWYGMKLKIQAGQDQKPLIVDKDQLASIWTGGGYILWKNFSACTGTIPMNCPEESILTLKLLLKDIGFGHLPFNTHYDAQTRSAVQFIQQKHGLQVDGVVGPLTKIAIYNDKPGLPIPHLISR